MVISLLDRAIYSYGDVDRLVGVSPGTARRWLEGYARGGRFYEPVLRPESTGDDSVTWGEMVEARLLAEYRARDVPTQRLREAVVRLRKEFGPYPLARARPFLDVEGRELVRAVQDEVGLGEPLRFVVVRNDQLILTPWTQKFQKSLTYEDNIASRISPNELTPAVVMDPQHTFGQPAIRNVRTESLAEDFRAGTSPSEIARLYDLSRAQVTEALRFEMIATRSVAA